MTRIVDFTVQNVKMCKSQKIVANSGHVFVIGKNEVGKSSILDGLKYALTGKDIPAEPLRRGARSGEVTVGLDNDTGIEWHLKPGKKPELILIDPTGEVNKTSARTKLNEIVGAIDFDVNGFFALSNTEQVKEMVRVLNIGSEMSVLESAYKEKYDIRTALNKAIKELKVKFDSAVLLQHKDLPNEPVLVVELLTELREKEEKNKTIQGIISKKEEKQKELKALHSSLKAFQRIFSNNDIVFSSEEIEGSFHADFMKKYNDLMSELPSYTSLTGRGDQLVDDIKKGNDWLAKNPLIDLTEINTKIENVDKINDGIREKNEALSFQKEIENKEIELENLQEQMDALVQKKKDLLSSKINIPDLEYDGEVFTWKGFEFDKNQINTASTIIAGLKIAKCLLKDLRILRFDGSLVDDQNMTKVIEWADENDIQLFVERLDVSATSESVTIKIVEVL